MMDWGTTVFVGLCYDGLGYDCVYGAVMGYDSVYDGLGYESVYGTVI
jgi:hypothetical protein